MNDLNEGGAQTQSSEGSESSHQPKKIGMLRLNSHSGEEERMFEGERDDEELITGNEGNYLR